jgi:hypothetical protein
MPFELYPDKLYLMGTLSRVRRRVGGRRDIANLSTYFAFLSAVYARFSTVFTDAYEIDDYVYSYFRSVHDDKIINLPLDLDNLPEMSQIREELCNSKYLKFYAPNNSAGLTQKGYHFLKECLNLMDNDVTSRRKDSHTRAVLESANILDEMLRKLNLNPTVVPSFPLIGTGIQYRENETTRKQMRYLIPDLIIKVNSESVPPELGLSKYVGAEIQVSHYDELSDKQVKYDTLAAEDPQKPISSSLYPLYVLRNENLRDHASREALLDRVRASIMKRIADAPEWVEMRGREHSPLPECPSSFLPHFNIGFLEYPEISFLQWPEGVPDD